MPNFLQRHRAAAALSFSLAALLALAHGAIGSAQNRSQQEAAKAAADSTTDQAMPPQDTATEMSEMASAMKSMADMCRMMMEREMQTRPYLMIAGAAVGALAFVALILFIVLEIQWIRLLGIRIKAERQKLSQ
jgi:hypothetical protein